MAIIQTWPSCKHGHHTSMAIIQVRPLYKHDYHKKNLAEKYIDTWMLAALLSWLERRDSDYKAARIRIGHCVVRHLERDIVLIPFRCFVGCGKLAQVSVSLRRMPEKKLLKNILQSNGRETVCISE